MAGAGSFAKEVANELPWLSHDFDLVVVESGHEPQSFGNSIVILASSKMLVRFVRDRGQVFVDVSQRSNLPVWWNLEHVCEAITGQRIERVYELSSIALLMRNHLWSIMERMGTDFDQLRAELERIKAQDEGRLL